MLEKDKPKHKILSKRLNVLFDGQNRRINPFSFGAIIDTISIIKEELLEEQNVTPQIYKGNNEFNISYLHIDNFQDRKNVV